MSDEIENLKPEDIFIGIIEEFNKIVEKSENPTIFRKEIKKNNFSKAARNHPMNAIELKIEIKRMRRKSKKLLKSTDYTI